MSSVGRFLNDLLCGTGSMTAIGVCRRWLIVKEKRKLP